MSIINRFKKVFEYGGIKEVFRKGTFYVIYKISNIGTLRKVKKTKTGFGINTSEKREKMIVVSMTTFPQRFDKIGIVIRSILYQDLKPDKIVIYLDGETKYSDLTEEMISFEKDGVEYRFHNETLLKCHSKYLFAMLDYPDAIIVTTDDDVILPHNWLRSLVDSYLKYPNAVSARRVHLMRYDNGGFLPYNHWFDQWRKEKKPSHLLFATGVGGVLYPPHCLMPEALNQEMIKKLSLNNDDIWLKCWEVMSGTPVVWVPNNEVALAQTENEQEVALSNTNVSEGRNDILFYNVLEYYGLKTSDFLYEK